jgi:hypothetical protein
MGYLLKDCSWNLVESMDLDESRCDGFKRVSFLSFKSQSGEIKMGLFFRLFFFALLSVFSLKSWSDCSSPAGKQGQFQYFSNTLNVCDGAYWLYVDINDFTVPCTAGQAGTIRFSSGKFEFCGDPKGSFYWNEVLGKNLGSCAGTTAGTFNYDASLYEPRFCDGTNWYSMRAPRQVGYSTTAADPAFGGLSAGDAICQADAVAAGLKGTWKAWLSTSTVDAKDRLLDNGPWYNKSTKIADDKADLIDGTLDSGMGEDLAGNGYIGKVMTGTSDLGVKTASNCINWTYNSGAVRGDPTLTRGQAGGTTGWSAEGLPICGPTSYRLICFQQ